MCTRFYFAVPAGMLTDEEREYREPTWAPEDYKREPCPAPCRKKSTPATWRPRYMKGKEYDGHYHKGYVKAPVPFAGPLHSRDDPRLWTWIKCPTCDGKSYVDRSRVEREAPTLWIPTDVGLVAVGPNGCSVIREAPRRKITEPIFRWPFTSPSSSRLSPEDASRLQRQAVAQLVRWTSARPDPRHVQSYSDRVTT